MWLVLAAGSGHLRQFGGEQCGDAGNLGEEYLPRECRIVVVESLAVEEIEPDVEQGIAVMR